MSPTVLLLLGWVGSVVGTFWWAHDLGQSAEAAKQLEINEVVRSVQEASQTAAAEEIRKIRIRHTTVREEVQREVVNQVVYRDCRHSPDGLRLVNEALTGTDAPATSRVRADDSVDGRHVRSDDAEAGGSGAIPPRVPTRPGDQR